MRSHFFFRLESTKTYWYENVEWLLAIKTMSKYMLVHVFEHLSGFDLKWKQSLSWQQHDWRLVFFFFFIFHDIWFHFWLLPVCTSAGTVWLKHRKRKKNQMTIMAEILDNHHKFYQFFTLHLTSILIIFLWMHRKLINWKCYSALKKKCYIEFFSRFISFLIIWKSLKVRGSPR